MSSRISAIGTANPEFKTSQDKIFGFMQKAFDLDPSTSNRFQQIYDQSGIQYRYSVLPDFGSLNQEFQNFFSLQQNSMFPGTSARMVLYRKNALGLALKAAENCLSQFPEGITKNITHIITVSCTGMYAPGIDIELIESLGLNRETERTCINFMGCYGAVNALKAADYICRSNPNSKVLIVCIELCTIHFQNKNTLDNWVANSLFSDGAAAVLVENSQERPQGPTFELGQFHSEFIPEARDEMAWNVGDMGFEMRLSSKVSKLVRKHLPAVAKNLLRKASLSGDEIQAYAIHPGGRTILEAAEDALGFDPVENNYAYEVLRDYGNMSSPTILFVLDKILNDPAKRGIIMSFAFGPGLTVESFLLTKTDG